MNFGIHRGAGRFLEPIPSGYQGTSIRQCNWSSLWIRISSTDSSLCRVSKFVEIVSTIQMVFITQPQKIKLHVPSCSESTNYSQWDKSGPRPVLDGLQANDGFYILNGWGGSEWRNIFYTMWKLYEIHISVSVSEVLLEHADVHSLHVVYGCFHTGSGGASSCSKDPAASRV